MADTSWKDLLSEKIAPHMVHEIDIFEGQMALMRQGKLSEKVFAETRLRKGVYGQRYDNAQRHDGQQTQQLDFPEMTKGPGTYWDAPGMQRIKIPFGRLTPVQLEVFAEVADEYSDGILHVTTRQDIQLHYVHIEDTPDLMRRLAAVGITTHEACGNVVRNITGCHYAGVCHTEPFDISPYAEAMNDFLLGHDDAQDFGRKFKIAFSGCEGASCGLAMMHDLGFIARVREVDGKSVRGFKVVVGGGLGAVPHIAQVYSEFVPEDEILPLTQAIARVFTRLGEKRNRNRARIKFLIAKLGLEAFRQLVEKERPLLPFDVRWTSYLKNVSAFEEIPLENPRTEEIQSSSAGFDLWQQTNVYPQRQSGFSSVTIRLPLGDLTSAQIVGLADIASHFVGDYVRLTVEQNIVLRWVHDVDLPAVYEALKRIELGAAGAESIVDITACPGTDTCKLGIASSRGLAGVLMKRLEAKLTQLPDAVRDLRIKISGCFNSCGQHHVADIGFYGNSRKAGNYKVPHFQVVLGGQWMENAGSFGLAIGAVPSRLVPDVLDVITQTFISDRIGDESFQQWVTRLGKKEARELIRPYMILPDYELQPEFFSDWGDPRVFTLSDIGVGECAGKVVSLFSIEIARAESEAFEAQIALDAGHYRVADERAYQAMILAARSLLRSRDPNVSDKSGEIVDAFRRDFYDTRLFFDQYAKGKFARYLFARHERAHDVNSLQAARQTVEEAQLFIEAAHACDMRLNTKPVEKKVKPSAAKLPPSFARS